jgi:glucokinase
MRDVADAARGLETGSDVAIALDLGGTHMKGGLVGPHGAHDFLERRDTPVETGYAGVLDEIVAFVADLRRRAAENDLGVVGIGIGAPGPLNRQTGVVEFAPNLGWREVPLARDLSRASGISREQLENDANAATFAESWAGESRGASCLLGVTLGTGIGGGLVIGGRLFAGVKGAAGELGHTVVDPGGRPCGCGKRGCVEAYFSARALIERPRELASEHPDHALELDGLTPGSMFEAWRGGDPLAGRVVEEGLNRLGLALAGAINLLNPDRVVFFGGLTGSWDLFGETLRERIRSYAVPEVFEAVSFGRSRLAWAGVLGAGGLLLDSALDP